MIKADYSKMTKEGYKAIAVVAAKAEKAGLAFGRDNFTIQMDLEHAHLDCGMDFEKLLAFDDGNFAHDMHGIAANINRETGKLDNCFLPRCTAH